jgi:cytochrome c oxidase subunit 4
MHDDAGHSSLRTYTVIYVWLVVLMLLTILASYLNLGKFNLTVAMVIALVKATLVVMYFMHVKYSGRLIWIYSVGAFLWLAILLALTFSDYLTRGWVPHRLPSLPTAGLFERPRVLGETAPAPSNQTKTNPRAIPRTDLSPSSTTQPTAIQPSGLD